jgi:hypothetical protein
MKEINQEGYAMPSLPNVHCLMGENCDLENSIVCPSFLEV